MENLRWYASLQSGQVKEVNESDLVSSLASLGLSGYEDEPCSQLSAGQKRRAGLARMAISRARLWVLDEPFTAVDVHWDQNTLATGLKNSPVMVAQSCLLPTSQLILKRASAVLLIWISSRSGARANDVGN
ncbi:MAG: ATP-binding cassette domain-containing protein [Porticoccaceae bacterium]